MIYSRLVFLWLSVFIILPGLSAQEVKTKNSMGLDLSGRVQLQHVYNDNLASADSISSHGFRMRRVRVQLEAKITDFLLSKIQIEVRDNSPRLKDAEGKLQLFNKYYFRFGQFKVPVWREEFIRSSGDLILVERSAAAEFLLLNLLSARHIGTEIGGTPSSKISLVLNYSNGSGEGISEIERQILVGGKLLTDANRGKMWSGRIDLSLDKRFQLGLSGVINYLGSRVDSLSNEGENMVVAPDFGIYLPAGFDLEGGLAAGTLSKSFVKTLDDSNFLLADLTGRWKKIFDRPYNQWGGLLGFELALGFSYIDCEVNGLEERNSFRFGPALYFSKKTRLQSNFELVNPPVEQQALFWRIRSQFTVNL
jgi:hypothetical protein